MANYLDTTGLKSLWKKIKSLVSGVSDEVTTVKNNYISKVWFNMFGKNSYQTKLTNYLSPATEAEGHDGVSNADIGIFASAPLVLGYNSKQNVEGTDIPQTMVITMQKASSTQDGYMTKKDKAIIDGLGTLSMKDSLAFADLTNTPTTLSGYGITDAMKQGGITNTDLYQNVPSDSTGTMTDYSSVGTTDSGGFLQVLRFDYPVPPFIKPGTDNYLNYGNAILFGGEDTKASIAISSDFPYIALTGGSHNKPTWKIAIRSDTNNKVYNLDEFLTTNGTTSDERKKENIVEADSLTALQSLGGVYEFDYKETGEHSVGFIAQKVQDGIFADIVSEDEDGYKQINYWSPKLVAAAVGAIGQLQKRVEELEAEVAKLKG